MLRSLKCPLPFAELLCGNNFAPKKETAIKIGNGRKKEMEVEIEIEILEMQIEIEK